MRRTPAAPCACTAGPASGASCPTNGRCGLLPERVPAKRCVLSGLFRRRRRSASGGFQKSLAAVGAGQLSFLVDRVYDGLEQVPQAHDDMEHDRAAGKLVVRVRHEDRARQLDRSRCARSLLHNIDGAPSAAPSTRDCVMLPGQCQLRPDRTAPAACFRLLSPARSTRHCGNGLVTAGDQPGYRGGGSGLGDVRRCQRPWGQHPHDLDPPPFPSRSAFPTRGRHDTDRVERPRDRSRRRPGRSAQMGHHADAAVGVGDRGTPALLAPGPSGGVRGTAVRVAVASHFVGGDYRRLLPPR